MKNSRYCLTLFEENAAHNSIQFANNVWMDKKPYFTAFLEIFTKCNYSPNSHLTNSWKDITQNCIKIIQDVGQYRDSQKEHPGRGLMGRCSRAELAHQTSEK